MHISGSVEDTRKGIACRDEMETDTELGDDECKGK